MNNIETRARGCLIGLACADALGGAVEFRSRGDLDRAFPDGIHEIVGGGPHRLDVGEYTDDTAMALAIARSCDSNGIDLEAVATNFVAWYRSGPKDIGIATRAALARIAVGEPWQTAGERLQAASADGVAGNGTVMRCAPIALRFFNNPCRLREASIETSRMTHADPRATWGAVALNQAIAHILSGGSLDGAIQAGIDEVPEERVARAIVTAAGLTREEVRSGGYVLDTLSAAFWCLQTTDTAELAIRRAVELGSDTDTTGAVTGALAGTLYGADAIPARWRSVLHDHDAIAALATQLVRWAVEDPAR